ncbi:type II toxin-antitoxin system VapC family toxin [Paraburkholderia nemoris]|uniref:type II toxin-antitoxin system VapC family toxin n=1 Tax=Paraburkholderia nemoris TaxID=2793076 RepID=UPI0019143263|nr:type II toxin-antitoxin system VapC family toxin [Paraburkholderia nemoris]MBK5151094.1 type II toxin-antitoxin system VapC family toxin [Burkholderia sp. R-69608]CAE6964531.1 Toxin FitB [Paraburkholderia nemoris]
MYLIDTNVISEIRRWERANPGVQRFFRQAEKEERELYLSVITVGELRRGVEQVRQRGDLPQAIVLERWMNAVLTRFARSILAIDEAAAHAWGRLRVPQSEPAVDKLIAATALTCDLVVVTRNVADFAAPGIRVVNPFD